VTYANEATTVELGVPTGLLKMHGAVSAEVAQAMAEGALKASDADLAVAVTGIAGPTGGTAEKPVGLVYFGLAIKGGKTQVVEKNLSPRRDVFKYMASQVALDLVRLALA
jgi:PncC family amidohydrolase